MPTVNNVVFCTSKFVKCVELTLNVLNTHQHQKSKEYKAILEGAGFVKYPDCGDDIMYICICSNSLNCIN